jgi:DNA/RNA-binding domain of Phe-tRNA-synthetase-like protein
LTTGRDEYEGSITVKRTFTYPDFMEGIMPDFSYRVYPEVFDKFPNFLRGVVLGFDLRNGTTPAELAAMLRFEEAAVRAKLPSDALNEHPRLKNWREAFRSLGIKPTEFRPSIEAMVRRVVKGDSLPLINTLVDIGNLISLRYMVPAGGHSMDNLTGNISLRPALGTEDFTAFGSTTCEHPDIGEIIFVEGNTVLTRRWVWRQGNHTLLVPETASVEINIDALPPVAYAEVDQICREVCGLVERFCGGAARYEILSAAHPEMSLENTPHS